MDEQEMDDAFREYMAENGPEAALKWACRKVGLMCRAYGTGASIEDPDLGVTVDVSLDDEE